MPTDPTGTVRADVPADAKKGEMQGHYVIRLGRLLRRLPPAVHLKPGRARSTQRSARAKWQWRGPRRRGISA